MSSFRKRVTSYFRQLSFHNNNETRQRRYNLNENTFVTDYLEGQILFNEGPAVLHGKNATDLPSYDIGFYHLGDEDVVARYTGPNGGLTTVKKVEKHLTVTDPDIDYIDTHDDDEFEADGDMRVSTSNDDRSLPHEWNVKSDHAFGLSDSLYDTDQVTKSKRNGDPIADCFGLIARSDSVVMALADGVNWGEKACVAAKCAIHGCLRYLNETVFDDTRPFRELIVKDENDSCVSAPSSIQSAQSTFHANRHNRVANTRDLFVCLLRSFSCAHQLILENGGTLTTLTVAVVLPLCGRSTNNKRLIERYHQSKRSNEKRNEDEDEMTKSADDHVQKSTTNEKIDEPFDYVCCVCNVGDTFAYVHSPIDGLRELTKGSHDVTVERDMRDALGALGPVDGNTKQPELSNLTLSVTVLRRGDVVMIASDGLTDNFDPNVCRFTVNLPESKTRTTCTRGDGDADGGRKSEKEQRERRQRMQDQQRHHKVDEPHRPPQHHPHGQRHRDGETTKEKSKAPTKPPRKNAKNGGRESVDRIANDDVAASVTRAKRPSATTESADVAQICETDVPSKPQEAPVINNALIAQFLQDNPLKPSSASTMSSSSNDKNKNEPKKCGDEGRASQTSGRKAGNCPEKKKQQQHQSSNYQHHTNHNRNVSKSSRHQQHKDQDQSLNKRADQKTSTRPPPSSSSSTITGAKKNDVKESSTTAATARHAFFRSKTTLGIITRTSTTPTSSSKAIKKKHAKKPIVRNDDGVPYVTPLQRYELTLLMMEDVIRRGLSGTDAKEKSSRGGPSISVTNARRLCETLVGFAFNVTSAKRRTLEDVDHYYDRRDGVLVEVSTQEKRTRRRRAMEKAQHLPGKLDHVSVVAWNVGNTTTTDSRSSSRTSYASS